MCGRKAASKTLCWCWLTSPDAEWVASGRLIDVLGRRKVGEFRSLPEQEKRPRYGHAVGGYREAAAAPSDSPSGSLERRAWRLVYLHRARAAGCVERLAATQHGQSAMAPSVVARPDGVVGDYNAAMLMANIAVPLRGAAAVDICEGNPIDVTVDQLYPGQVLSVRGEVLAGAEVLPSSVLLSTTSGSVRLLVDRSLGLHLNQRYLTGRAICAVGIVQSVPRQQMRAVAMCIFEQPLAATPVIGNDQGG